LVVSACPAESTRTRSSESIVEFTPSGATLPVLSERLSSDSVLPVGSRDAGFAVAPCGGLTPFAKPCSAGLFGLAGIAATRSCVCAIFLLLTSNIAAVTSLGPLSVLRAADLAAARLAGLAGVLVDLGMIVSDAARRDCRIAVRASDVPEARRQRPPPRDPSTRDPCAPGR
jgi:hypothetical protein